MDIIKALSFSNNINENKKERGHSMIFRFSTKKTITLMLVTLLLLVITACGKTSKSTTSTEDTTSRYSLELNKETYTINKQEVVKLELTFLLNDEQGDWSLLAFTSSDSNVVIVDAEGNITGINAGQATITIIYLDKNVIAEVNVNEDVLEVVVPKTAYTLLLGDEGQDNVTINVEAYKNGVLDQNPTLIWTVEDESIATVNDNGQVQALAKGKTNVIIDYLGKKVTIEINVNGYEYLTAEEINTFSPEYINLYGRNYLKNGALNIDHVSAGIEFGIYGTYVKAKIIASATIYLNVFVDDNPVAKRIRLTTTQTQYTLVDNLDNGYHKIRLVKSSELNDGTIQLSNLESEKFVKMEKNNNLKIEFIGDSITAGYGALGTGATRTVENSDGASSFVYLTAQKLNLNYSIVALRGICTEAYHWQKQWNMSSLYKVVSMNYTTTYDFSFNPDVVVIGLGTNEASYIQSAYNPGYAQYFKDDYKEFLEYVREKNPNALIISIYGMMGKNSTIDNGIQQAINELNDENIVYLNDFVANTAGANGHPNSNAHKGWANYLADYLVNKFNLSE